MATTKRWFVIGISGATCSGKSTLAKKIYDNFPGSVMVQQDDYFLPVDDLRHVKVAELNHINWEVMTSLDMQKMHSDVLKILELHEKSTAHSSGRRLLILDGFLLFKHKAITDLCDRKYFLTLSEELCCERRTNRPYEPPDPPGYFEKVVWPEYINYKREITGDNELCATITFIDGSTDVEEIYETVSKEISQLLL
ncbi:nicotinamide riboside kinase 1 [Harpegnathos saltator]|uniref:Nicotinamide riboside kinase 1 n=1 Tax=Harpegnathos saltator TaxID=610380 RepID=E2BPK4_HARSA|nr:nicotinamide riboside kinase 1 [Harpegnathos saltator]EFN82408.1 Nicotinamide riboside kinase 1 [Harpegnathos saltator]